jgi:hypothetical protein
MSKVTKYYCDVCGAELQDVEAYSRTIPVLMHVINEYGTEIKTRVEFTKMDICFDCLDRAAAFESNVGAVCPVDGEGEYRLREPREVDG